MEGGLSSVLETTNIAPIRTNPSGDATQAVRPTSVRWWILSIVMAIMAVTALNRLNLSIAGKFIEEEFSFSTIAMGGVFSAFLWGYALFQIPWGYICDRIGPRRTLTASIFCFAVGSGAMVFAPRFAAATGVSALAVFRIVRFLTLHPGPRCVNADSPADCKCAVWA